MLSENTKETSFYSSFLYAMIMLILLYFFLSFKERKKEWNNEIFLYISFFLSFFFWVLSFFLSLKHASAPKPQIIENQPTKIKSIELCILILIMIGYIYTSKREEGWRFCFWLFCWGSQITAYRLQLTAL